MQYDMAIIGAGVLGLWAARHAIKAGKQVILIEKRKIGAGASAGFLGALMPHMPDGWDTKKQFQYEGLVSLESAVEALESDTGVSSGFRRCGRIMPLPEKMSPAKYEMRTQGAREFWQGQFELQVYDDPAYPGMPDDWVSAELAVHGVQHDTLSARINPRQHLKALAAYVRPRVTLLENTQVTALEPVENRIRLASGETISAGQIVVANGWEAYPLLQPFMGHLNQNKPIGRGVKGQAVLVEYEHDDSLPIVYHEGVYVVPHSGNRVAIGSTTQNDWLTSRCPEPDTFDDQNMEFYQKAIELVPALVNAPIIERWAAVRPRNLIKGRGTEPWFGPVPDHDNLIALIGGFKITLGIAHVASDTLLR